MTEDERQQRIIAEFTKRRKKHQIGQVIIWVGVGLLSLLFMFLSSQQRRPQAWEVILVLMGVIAMITGSFVSYAGWRCPACKEPFRQLSNPKYCPACGQRLKLL